eukprot:scaffold3289_cov163-Amphora_coffeaeformis.AAC.7
MSSDYRNLVVVAPTFYSNMQETRFILGMKTCQEAARQGIHLILVDASPTEEIRDQLRASGTTADGKSYVDVLIQTHKGKKGAALREAVIAAGRKISAEWSNDRERGKEVIVCFQEPEKDDMMRHWKDIAKYMQEEKADICVPRRSGASFQASYPKEQYHSETFGNMYLDTLAKAVDFQPSIDWLMGPIAWRHEFSYLWTEYVDGDLWDSQICPMIHAQRWHGAKVSSLEIDFAHPVTMKREEEGSPVWIEKRLMQLNCIFEKVGKSLKETKEEYEGRTKRETVANVNEGSTKRQRTG